MNNNQWSEEMENALRQLWAEGHSAAVIAAKLGFDPWQRGRVLGKARRLKLPHRKMGGQRQNGGRKPKHLRPKAPEPGSFSLLDLRPNQCRWPNDHHPNEEGFGFCGAPRVPGRAYCAYHCHVAVDGEKTAALKARHKASYQPRTGVLAQRARGKAA